MIYFHVSCDVMPKMADYYSLFDPNDRSETPVTEINTSQLHGDNKESDFDSFYIWVKDHSKQVIALTCYHPKGVDYSKITELIGRCHNLRYLSLNSCHPLASDENILHFIEPLKKTKIKKITLQWANITKKSIEALAEIPSITNIDVRNCMSLKKLEKEQLSLIQTLYSTSINWQNPPLGYENL